jgi:hypothetical protein
MTADKARKLTNDEAQQLQQAWREILLAAGETDSKVFAKLRDLFERAYDAGCDRNRPVTLVVVAASATTGVPRPSDVLILRHNPLESPSPVGWEMFKNLIGGTMQGPIRPPVHVFLFDDRGNAVQGEIDANGNWVSLPF